MSASHHFVRLFSDNHNCVIYYADFDNNIQHIIEYINDKNNYINFLIKYFDFNCNVHNIKYIVFNIIKYIVFNIIKYIVFNIIKYIVFNIIKYIVFNIIKSSSSTTSSTFVHLIFPNYNLSKVRTKTALF